MQAAGGASLTDGSSQRGAESRPATRRRALALFVVVFAVLYAADQLTKVLAVEHLTGQPDKPLVGEVLQLHLTRNPGAAFSTGTAFTEALTCVAIGAVLAILWFARKVVSPLWGVALGVLLAGVVGNLTDRMLREPGPFRGHVIDFLMLPNWPIFNIADICINVAAGLILVQAFRGVRMDGTRLVRDEEEDAGD